MDFIRAKDCGGGGNNWSYKTCKAPVKSSPSTNQHPAFYRPDAFPVAQPTVSEHSNENHQTHSLYYIVCNVCTSIMNDLSIHSIMYKSLKKWSTFRQSTTCKKTFLVEIETKQNLSLLCDHKLSSSCKYNYVMLFCFMCKNGVLVLGNNETSIQNLTPNSRFAIFGFSSNHWHTVKVFADTPTPDFTHIHPQQMASIPE